MDIGAGPPPGDGGIVLRRHRDNCRPLARRGHRSLVKRARCGGMIAAGESGHSKFLASHIPSASLPRIHLGGPGDPMISQWNGFVRLMELLWRRMGSARFYVLGVIAVILALAVTGLFHLIDDGEPSRASAPAVASNSPPAAAASPTPADRKTGDTKPLPDPEERPVARPLLALTDVIPQERSHTSDHSGGLDLTIGITPRRGARNGAVEIRVSFFEQTATGEIRSTDAEIRHRWLTAERIWSEPTPKYLLVSYMPRDGSRSGDELRYAGYLVRVYLDGELHDQRGEPATILTALRQVAQSGSATSTPSPSESASLRSAAAASSAASLTPTTTPSRDTRASAAVPPAEADAIPYGKPVPNKPGFVFSPYDEKFLIDVRGMPPGVLVKDPNTGKSFRVP